MHMGKKVSVVILVPFLTGHGGMETVLTDVVNHYSQDSVINMQVYFGQGVRDDHFCQKFIRRSLIINGPKVQEQSVTSRLSGLVKTVLFLIGTSANEIVCMSPILVKIAATIKRVFRKKYSVISWVHFSLVGGNLTSIQYLKYADRHFAISSGIKRQLVELGVSSNNIAVVYNPINITAPMIPFDEDHSDTNFLYVGRLQWTGQKNLQELFNALINLRGDWHLSVVGSGEDAPIQAFIEEYHLASHVTLLGWQSEPWTNVSNIDCTVLSSKFEGLPMCIIESIIRGIPCVSSNCPTGPDDLITKENGYIYPMGQVSALTEKLQYFIDRKVQFNHEEVRKSLNWLNESKYYQHLTILLTNYQNTDFAGLIGKY